MPALLTDLVWMTFAPLRAIPLSLGRERRQQEGVPACRLARLGGYGKHNTDRAFFVAQWRTSVVSVFPVPERNLEILLFRRRLKCRFRWHFSETTILPSGYRIGKHCGVRIYSHCYLETGSRQLSVAMICGDDVDQR